MYFTLNVTAFVREAFWVSAGRPAFFFKVEECIQFWISHHAIFTCSLLHSQTMVYVMCNKELSLIILLWKYSVLISSWFKYVSYRTPSQNRLENWKLKIIVDMLLIYWNSYSGKHFLPLTYLFTFSVTASFTFKLSYSIVNLLARLRISYFFERNMFRILLRCSQLELS